MCVCSNIFLRSLHFDEHWTLSQSMRESIRMRILDSIKNKDINILCPLYDIMTGHNILIECVDCDLFFLPFLFCCRGALYFFIAIAFPNEAEKKTQRSMNGKMQTG